MKFLFSTDDFDYQRLLRSERDAIAGNYRSLKEALNDLRKREKRMNQATEKYEIDEF